MKPQSQITPLLTLALLILGCFSCSLFEGTISVETGSPMQFTRIDLGTAVVGGKVYAIGGFTDQTVPYVEEYDPDSDTWTRKTDMPTARRLFALGVIDGVIYVTGGMDFTDGNNVTYVYSTEKYDPSSDMWSTASDFPMAPPVNSVLGNAFVSGVAMAKQLYVIVYNTEEPGGAATYVYDTLTDAWSPKSSPPRWEYGQTEEITAVACSGRIYVFCCGDLAEYDPSADLWTVRPSAHDERYGGGACALGDRLYAIGGVDDGYLIPGVEVYRTDTDLWARQGWIANPKAFFSSVALDDAVYLLGGSFSNSRDSAEPLDLVERIYMRE